MALKSTIYKAELHVADMDRNYFQVHHLTLARHPSETEERLMVRLLVFGLYANEMLVFGKGLSDEEEPDLWQKDLTGAIDVWINVGLPTEKAIRKAAGKSKKVIVVLYGGHVADLWWQQNSKALLKMNNVTILNLPNTVELTDMAERNLNVSCTIQDGQILVSHDAGSFDIIPAVLYG